MEELFSPEGFGDPGAGPLYLQLHRRIADAIASGRLRPGDSLPPEREMAALTIITEATVMTTGSAKPAKARAVGTSPKARQAHSMINATKSCRNRSVAKPINPATKISEIRTAWSSPGMMHRT